MDKKRIERMMGAGGGWRLPLALAVLAGMTMAIPLASQARSPTPPFEEYPPSFDGAVIIPAIRKQGEVLLIAIRHSNPGYLAVRHFDTEILRFRTDAAGRIENCRRFSRMIGGEVFQEEYVWIPGGNDTGKIVESGGDMRIVARLRLSSGGMTAEEEGWKKEYRPDRDSGFSIMEEDFSGSSLTGWTLSGGTASSIKSGGLAHGTGIFRDWKTGEYSYSEHRESDPDGFSRYDIHGWKSGGEQRIRIDGVEPWAEIYAVDMSHVLKNSAYALHNLVFLDVVVGRDVRIAPLLVLLRLGVI